MFRRIKTRIYYGWVIVFAIMITTVVLMGARHSFGVFFKPLASDFELSRAMTSSLFSVYMLLCAVFSVIGGWALDKYGIKKAFFMMALFGTASLLLTSQTNSWWQLFLTYSLLLSVGTAPLYAVGQSALSKWFDRKRGLAMGLTTSGVGIGQMLFAPLAALLIAAYGWRISYITFGLLIAIIMIPLSRLMKDEPGEMGLLPDGDRFRTAATTETIKEKSPQLTGISFSQAIKSWNYWIYLPAWFFTGISNWLVLTHIVPYATDVGIHSVEAATIISVNGVVVMLGSIFVGRIVDIKGKKIPGVFIALTRVIALIGVIWAREIWMFYLFAVAFGISQSGMGVILGALCADIFGKRSLGVIMGTLTGAFSIGAAVGPLMGGLFFDANSSYTLAFIAGSFISMLVAFSVFFVKVEDRSTTGG